MKRGIARYLRYYFRVLREGTPLQERSQSQRASAKTEKIVIHVSLPLFSILFFQLFQNGNCRFPVVALRKGLSKGIICAAHQR